MSYNGQHFALTPVPCHRTPVSSSMQVERRVREATRNEPWGPTGAMLSELADRSLDPEQCQIIMVSEAGRP